MGNHVCFYRVYYFETFCVVSSPLLSWPSALTPLGRFNSLEEKKEGKFTALIAVLATDKYI